MSLVLLFVETIKTASLMVMAYVMVSLWSKWETKTIVEHNKKADKKDSPEEAVQWQAAEKKYRAKVYDE
jgi:hypothetical protein